MRHITAKEALELTRDMWRYIADYKLQSKTDYFIFKEIGTLDRPRCLCYLCEYVKQNSETDCGIRSDGVKARCLLNWGENALTGKALYCESDSSPYSDWFRDHYAKDAIKIVNLCNEALERLDQEAKS